VLSYILKVETSHRNFAVAAALCALFPSALRNTVMRFSALTNSGRRLGMPSKLLPMTTSAAEASTLALKLDFITLRETPLSSVHLRGVPLLGEEARIFAKLW
jgi:hypothetical protein